MKKGLFFVAAIAILYWAFFYLKKKVPVKPKPLVTGDQIKAPIQKAEVAVHKANINILEVTIEIFHLKEGRYPEDIQELVEKRYLPKIPDSGDIDWEYNPADGSVN